MAGTPQEVAQKWANRLSAATQDIQRGVERVTENPMQKAAAKKTKMLQNLTKAVNDGKWEQGLNRVSLADWKNAMVNKGLPRISGGAQNAIPRMTTFMQALLPYQDNLKSQINTMPDLSLQDNINRATAWITGMANFQRP